MYGYIYVYIYIIHCNNNNHFLHIEKNYLKYYKFSKIIDYDDIHFF